MITSCAVHGRYYDRGHNDYHRWGRPERDSYVRWETETKRPHQDYKKRKDDDRQQYWNWRHDHP